MAERMSGPGAVVTEGDDQLIVAVAEVEIARYDFRPVMPVTESSKPYLYPVRSLTGAPPAGYRPWDHRWHKGLQMTLSHLSGQNFWGGPTFDPALRGDAPNHGYVQRETTAASGTTGSTRSASTTTGRLSGRG